MRTLTRGIRLTPHELAWIKQAISNLGLDTQTDSDAIRAVIYTGLETLTAGAWTNREPDPRWLESTRRAMNRQRAHKKDSHNSDLVQSLKKGLSSTRVHGMPLEDNDPSEDFSPRFLARTEQESLIEQRAHDMILHHGVSSLIPKLELEELDPRTHQTWTPSRLSERKMQIQTTARFIQENYTNQLTEQERARVKLALEEDHHEAD